MVTTNPGVSHKAQVNGLIVKITSVLLLCGILALVIGWGMKIFISTNYTTCADGWGSPSIGRQGACSWHGGEVDVTVDLRTPTEKAICAYLFKGSSVLISIAVIFGFLPYRSERIRIAEEEKNKAEESARKSKWVQSMIVNTRLGLRVPLTIDNQTRLVEVRWTDSMTVETVDNVVVFRQRDCSVADFNDKVRFTYLRKHFFLYPNLEGYVTSTRQDYVTAVGWSDECNDPPIPREQEYQPLYPMIEDTK